MIGGTDPHSRRYWAQSVILAATLHGAVGAGLLYRPPIKQPQSPAIVAPQIDVSIAQPAADAPEAPTAATEPAIPVETERLKPAPPETTAPNVIASQEILTSAIPAQALTPALPPVTGAQAPGDATANDEPEQRFSVAGGEAADSQLSPLYQRIRDRLSDSCLLALPQVLSDATVRLGVLSANEASITSFMAEITEGLDMPVTETPVLLDSRQCPALIFARSAAFYPAFGLTLQLEANEIPSAGTLRGRIEGGAGYDNTLLLVDDNGVVQDLRRFMIVSAAGQIAFDVPLARIGAPRDTAQLLIAVATPTRPASVTTNAGRLAQDFFPGLTAETGVDTQIGVAAIYVR